MGLNSGALTLALLAALACGMVVGWKERDTQANLQLLDLRKTYDDATAKAKDESRAVEQAMQVKINDVGKEARDESHQIDSRSAIADASTDGLLNAAVGSIRATTCDPGVARRGEAATSAAYLYSQLLGESQRLAKGLAEEADRARAAGVSCEVAYETVREGLKRMGRP